MPEKISALGIDLNPAQTSSLLYILAGVVIYFLAAFVIYAWSDLRRRETIAAQIQARLRPALSESLVDFQQFSNTLKNQKDPEKINSLLNDERFKKLSALSQDSRIASRVSRAGTSRIIFDVYLPIPIGLLSAIVIVAHAIGFPGWTRMGIGLLITTTFLLLLWALIRRKTVYRWYRKRIRIWRDREFNKALDDIKAYPEGDPRREKLQQKMKKRFETYFQKKLKDMREGIY